MPKELKTTKEMIRLDFSRFPMICYLVIVAPVRLRNILDLSKKRSHRREIWLHDPSNA